MFSGSYLKKDKYYLCYAHNWSWWTFKFGADWNIRKGLVDIEIFLGFFTMGVLYYSVKTAEEDAKIVTINLRRPKEPKNEKRSHSKQRRMRKVQNVRKHSAKRRSV